MGREHLEYGIPLRTVDAANDPSLFSDVSEGERVGHAERLVGQLVDQRYELRRLIAVGAAGAVFDACQTGLGRRVALKLMQSQGDPAADADLRRRVKLEAETLARLAHPNVVGVFDVGVWRGQSFLVMEMLTGRTLSEVLREVRRMPLGRLIPIARQICRALDVTHRAGVIHRDLKPSNVMITAFGDVLDHVKLVDFGVAKDLRAASQLTVQGTMLGTPKYMAPEQISCDAEAIGPATDIYALGALLYRASIGRGVFPGLQGVQQLVAHVREPPPPFDEALPGHGLPRRFEEVVLQCLSKRPQDRFSSARALEAELAEIEARLTPADFGAPKVAPRPAPASLAAHERTMFTQMSPALAEVEPLPEVEVELEAAPGWAAWRAAVVAAAVIVGGLAGLGVARSPGELTPTAVTRACLVILHQKC
ncbi:MAG TPA: serine/threonine-protein kinase, partial [Myxococcota bacterium]|nr:serine/threonine-protein kinase [Myxococcota bacterium]